MVYEPRTFGAVERILYYAVKEKKKDHRMMVYGIGIFAFGEDTRDLRLTNELVDLRSWYTNPAPSVLWRESSIMLSKKRKKTIE